MKRKKQVTEAVLAANRANAQSSTGPRTEPGKSNARYNAFKHGILAVGVVLNTDKEREDFQELLQSCREDWHPQGLEEDFYTKELAIIYWKLDLQEGMEAQELSRRQELSGKVDGVFRKSPRLPIDNFDLPLLNRGWDCERLVVRAVSGKDNVGSTASRRPAVIQNQIQPGWHASVKNQENKADHLELEAVMVSSLSVVTRYRLGLKRDLRDTIKSLRDAQRERREREK